MASVSITRRRARPEDKAFLSDTFVRSMCESITACRGQWNEVRERDQFERQLDLEGTRVIQVNDVDVGFILSVLKTNPRADALYRRLGFAVVEETEHHRHMKHRGGP